MWPGLSIFRRRFGLWAYTRTSIFELRTRHISIQFITIQISKIPTIEPMITTRPRSAFVVSAQLQRLSVDLIYCVPVLHFQRDHTAISYGRLFSVKWSSYAKSNVISGFTPSRHIPMCPKLPNAHGPHQCIIERDAAV